MLAPHEVADAAASSQTAGPTLPNLECRRPFFAGLGVDEPWLSVVKPTIDAAWRDELSLDERMIRRLLLPMMQATKAGDDMMLMRGMCTSGTTTPATGGVLMRDEALRELGLDLDARFAVLQSELPISTAHEQRRGETKRLLFSAARGLDRA